MGMGGRDRGEAKASRSYDGYGSEGPVLTGKSLIGLSLYQQLMRYRVLAFCPHQKGEHIGDDSQKMRGVLYLRYPVRHGVITSIFLTHTEMSGFERILILPVLVVHVAVQHDKYNLYNFLSLQSLGGHGKGVGVHVFWRRGAVPEMRACNPPHQF